MKVAHTVPLAFVFSTLIASFGMAADGSTPAEDPLIIDANDVDLNEFLWKKRPIVVFADSENDPKFIEQLTLLEDRTGPLKERDVVVLTDTDASNLSDLRKKLRPRGFMIVIIGKEGRVQLRKPFPWNVREITRTIDKLPLRQREIREAGAGG